jgi:hypothetical protein
VVDKGPGAVLLCVRKKLLKQSETNVADPAVEVSGATILGSVQGQHRRLGDLQNWCVIQCKKDV